MATFTAFDASFFREEMIMEQEVTRITSFSINHDVLLPGLYVSRVDGDVTTYDMRTMKRPAIVRKLVATGGNHRNDNGGGASLG